MRNVSTRLLLTSAAIGVGGGLVFVANVYLGALISAVAPVFYGLLIGLYFVPGVIAQSLLRRGGVAVLSGLIAGLVGGAFAPQWFLRFLATGILIGLVQEIPFAVTRYRVWSPWIFYVTAIVGGVIAGAGVFIAIGGEKYVPLLSVVYFGLFTASPLLFTWFSRLIARAVEKTGVTRGLTPAQSSASSVR